MEPALLQQLLLLCLATQPVPGSPREHVPRYVLEPLPCRSAPENCTQMCTTQEDCPPDLQCCSAFCGIVCSWNQPSKNKRPK
ncbi:WAP four-disulfide core domain protein 13 [Tamandua tetradactyla]|uniref:WAP four-disulfide core domain protein 13 n=1 Tax=Tamandua tetradactyla TaxID=48850 RepID=UPI004054947C